jgi:UDPglucose 6-dehydrogenase
MQKYLSNQLIINYTFMNIAIVGTGYVGLVSGTCFADTGANVTCVDVDAQKIERLKNGEIPIFEPGLDELVVKNVKAGRLHFTTDLSSVLDDVQIVFSAVGTPPDEDGSADLKYVLQVARTIGQHMNHYLVVVTKSTVPVGTASKVRKAIEEELAKRGLQDLEFDVASNPEFLKEGNAIKDFMSPDRVVVGVESEHAKKVLTKLYKPFLINNFRVIFMDIPSAEMTKYAANSMLATRISFMNDIANLCERVGADVNMVRAGIGADTRIGRKFLYAGCGYGGSCFPKDVKALIKTADQNGYSMEVLKAVERVNERQKSILFEKLQKAFKGEDLKGKTIAMWGLSFKPETDDMRESTALVMIRLLLEAGCTVRAYDPVAMNECKRRIGDTVTYCNDMYDATLDADALLLLTEWKEFRLPTWAVIKKAMKRPLVIDGRNIFDSEDLEENGFEYHCIGK